MDPENLTPTARLLIRICELRQHIRQQDLRIVELEAEIERLKLRPTAPPPYGKIYISTFFIYSINYGSKSNKLARLNLFTIFLKYCNTPLSNLKTLYF